MLFRSVSLEPGGTAREVRHSRELSIADTDKPRMASPAALGDENPIAGVDLTPRRRDAEKGKRKTKKAEGAEKSAGEAGCAVPGCCAEAFYQDL